MRKLTIAVAVGLMLAAAAGSWWLMRPQEESAAGGVSNAGRPQTFPVDRFGTGPDHPADDDRDDRDAPRVADPATFRDDPDSGVREEAETLSSLMAGEASQSQ